MSNSWCFTYIEKCTLVLILVTNSSILNNCVGIRVPINLERPPPDEKVVIEINSGLLEVEDFIDKLYWINTSGDERTSPYKRSFNQRNQ